MVSLGWPKPEQLVGGDPLPAIAGYFEILRNDVRAPRDVRDRHSAALGRVLTEDWSFSESRLGTDLIKLADDYASLPD